MNNDHKSPPPGCVPTYGDDGVVYLKPAVATERRERIATAALQAMELPNGLKYSSYDWVQGVPQGWAALAAKMAVLHADALIAELDRKKGG